MVAAEVTVGAEERLDLIAASTSWRTGRSAGNPGRQGHDRGMSRRIAVRLYEKIVALRPEWHDPDPNKGVIKVVMTGSTDDPPEYQPHVYTKDVRKDLKLGQEPRRPAAAGHRA